MSKTTAKNCASSDQRLRQALDLDKLSLDEIDELLVALAAQRRQDNSEEHDRELDGWKP